MADSLFIPYMKRFDFMGPDWYFAYNAIILHVPLTPDTFALVCASNVLPSASYIYALFRITSDAVTALSTQQLLVDGSGSPLVLPLGSRLTSVTTALSLTSGESDLYGTGLDTASTPFGIHVKLVGNSLVASQPVSVPSIPSDRAFAKNRTFRNKLIYQLEHPIDNSDGIRATEVAFVGQGFPPVLSNYMTLPNASDVPINQDSVIFTPYGAIITENLLSVSASVLGAVFDNQGLAVGVVVRTLDRVPALRSGPDGLGVHFARPDLR